MGLNKIEGPVAMNDDGSKKKLIAILLATYNGALYLDEFLHSLCAQSCKDFCIYVRDDSSTDSTPEILSAYSCKLDLRIIPSGVRLGPAKGFFKILEAAGESHDCYLFADQDDYWYPDKVERAAAALVEHSDEILLYCSRLEYVDAKLSHIKYSRIPRIISLQNAAVENIATGCTIGITRKVRADILAGNPYDFIMHDWWLYLYCSAFGRVMYDSKPSIKYRQHDNNTIGAATGIAQDLKRRLARFFRRDGGIHLLSMQVNAFLYCHGDHLNKPNRRILEMLVQGKHRFLARLRLAILLPVSRQSYLDNFVLRFLFLLGRY